MVFYNQNITYFEDEQEKCAKNEAKSKELDDQLIIEKAAIDEEKKDIVPLQMKLLITSAGIKEDTINEFKRSRHPPPQYCEIGKALLVILENEKRRYEWKYV